MNDDFTSLWSEASVDAEAERIDRLFITAKIEALPQQNFVIQAVSEEDYSNRLAMVQDDIDHAVIAAVGEDADYETFSQVKALVEAALIEDWANATQRTAAKYKAFYKDKTMDVEATSSYEAQQKAAEAFGAKKGYEVSVVLAERDDGSQVTHDPAQFAGSRKSAADDDNDGDDDKRTTDEKAFDLDEERFGPQDGDLDKDDDGDKDDDKKTAAANDGNEESEADEGNAKDPSNEQPMSEPSTHNDDDSDDETLNKSAAETEKKTDDPDDPSNWGKDPIPDNDEALPGDEDDPDYPGHKSSSLQDIEDSLALSAIFLASLDVEAQGNPFEMSGPGNPGSGSGSADSPTTSAPESQPWEGRSDDTASQLSAQTPGLSGGDLGTDPSAAGGAGGATDPNKQSMGSREPAEEKKESSLDVESDYHYIRERDGKYEIWQKGTGKTLSTHDSREKAEESFRAMMQSKHGSVEVDPRETAILRITAGVIAANPEIDPTEARKLAVETVEKYPTVVRGA